MSDQTKLSDSDLNSLLATRVMGWQQVPNDNWWYDSEWKFAEGEFCPTADYNHLRYVEDALSEKYFHRYINEWKSLVVFSRATARQRCDAIAKVLGES